MKTSLPTNIASGITQQVTIPLYLVELHFSSILYLSTRQQATYNDGTGINTYLKSGTNVRNVSEKGVIVELDNSDGFSGSAIVLGEGVRDKVIRIYAAYGEGSTLGTDDVYLYFEGYMSHVSSIDANKVVIQSSFLSEELAYTPRIYCAPPLCNHIPPTGTKLGTYTLEREN